MKLRNKRILISGGAGFIGSHVAERLINENYIRIVDDLSQGSYDNVRHLEKERNFDFIKASITDLEEMTKVCRDIDVVMHLAAVNIRRSINDPIGVERICANGSICMCEAAYRNNVRRFLYCSSSEVYGTAVNVPMKETHPLNPMTVYGASKLAGEHYALAYLRTYKMPVVIVRPFNTYGPREVFAGVHGEVIPRFIVQALNKSPLTIFGNGSQTRDFMYVTDCARGLIMACESDEMTGAVVNIGSGGDISIRKLAEKILDICGFPRDLMKSVGERPGDVLQLFADSSKAKEIFGFKTEVSLDEGIRNYIDWVKENHLPLDALKTIKNKNW